MSAVKRSEPTRPSRRQRAEATHWRIVKAAYTLFCEQGYAGTTMAQIAQAAGVAVQTVYFVFHTKAALLGRAYEFAVKGEHEPLIPQQQAWHAAMAAELRSHTGARAPGDGGGEIMRRVTPLYLVARVGADGDPDAAGSWPSTKTCEPMDTEKSSSSFVARPRSSRLTLERATDLLLLLAGMDAYHVLVGSHDWSHEEWVDWTVPALAEQVFGRTA